MDNSEFLSTADWLDPKNQSLHHRQFLWEKESDAQLMAQRWAHGIANCPDVVIALVGDLGAGKTTFTRHLLQALGVSGRIKSPTYTLMESYEIDRLGLAYHFDFYRFNDENEWEDAGFRDVFAGPGLKLVEWPERVHTLLPQPDLVMHIVSIDDVSRSVDVHAWTATGLKVLE